MSQRLRGQIGITNDTPHPLRRLRYKLPHGSWTDPHLPPETIAPGAREEFRSEGGLVASVPTGGTEGRIWFQIGEDPQATLYVHWNVPHVTSQYGNTYHVWATPQYEAAHTGGGQRPRAQLEVRLSPTARRGVRGFTPDKNGFVFANKWDRSLPVLTLGEIWRRLQAAMPKGIGVALLPGELVLPFVDDTQVTHGAHGLCGGMVFAAMDYWNADQAPPEMTEAPKDSADPLFQYVRQRLIDSFDFAGQGHRWIAYSSPHYPDGDAIVENVGMLGRAYTTYRLEWPRIRDDLADGRLSPIGLVQTKKFGIDQNHQVLAYAYEQSGQEVTLWIYDPSIPNTAVTLRFDITHTDRGVAVHRSHGDRAIYCIFRMDGYQPQSPVGGSAGRPSEAGSVRHLLDWMTGTRAGSVNSALRTRRRPISLRDVTAT
jgi:hypothetical protein